MRFATGKIVSTLAAVAISGPRLATMERLLGPSARSTGTRLGRFSTSCTSTSRRFTLKGWRSRQTISSCRRSRSWSQPRSTQHLGMVMHRTPGKGVGHLFVMDRQGHLQKDIVLGDGDMYHPGGIDFDGRNVSSETRGLRRFYEWNLRGRRLGTWQNASFFVDYQDCQYVESAKMMCGGVTNLPQTPTAGGDAGVYELGGLALVDLKTHRVLREIPFQRWSTAGHVITRNPVKLAVVGGGLDLWAAPDNGEERNGTEVFHFRATGATPIGDRQRRSTRISSPVVHRAGTGCCDVWTGLCSADLVPPPSAKEPT